MAVYYVDRTLTLLGSALLMSMMHDMRAGVENKVVVVVVNSQK